MLDGSNKIILVSITETSKKKNPIFPEKLQQLHIIRMQRN
jgi:hypothetical protein